MDESQIAYAGPDRRLALAWDEIGEIKGSMEYLILRPRNCEARRELRIPDSILDPSDEFIVLLHRYCPVARGVSRGAVTLPWVFREARGKRVLRWTATVALLALALGLLLAGNPILTLVGLLLLAAELLLALFTLITPSFAMVTKEDVTLRSPLRSWKLRHDEIEEIVPAPPWVRVVSRGKGFAFHCPGLTLLATYDLLVTAWESAGHGKEQST
ncbi:MAG: hypothetical protein FJ291_03930 [Planctomycetes bacterium]|nr:hypothetical protein [Planctomycetota bacterium]